MDYEDIIHLPHWEPRQHKRMPLQQRAAQFAPFAALTGYDAAIEESGRETMDELVLEEYGSDRLNRKMALLTERMAESPSLTIVYFQPDSRKRGGSYQSVTDRVKRIDDIDHLIVMQGGQRIPIAAIVDIEGLEDEDEVFDSASEREPKNDNL